MAILEPRHLRSYSKTIETLLSKKDMKLHLKRSKDKLYRL